MRGFRQFTETTDISLEHEILNMYKDSSRWHIRKISEVTGMSIAGIYRILEKYGVKPHLRMHNDAYNIIQQYRNSGVPVHKISELTGYSSRQVYNILAKGKHLFNA